jgi:hypothetical protein
VSWQDPASAELRLRTDCKEFLGERGDGRLSTGWRGLRSGLPECIEGKLSEGIAVRLTVQQLGEIKEESRDVNDCQKWVYPWKLTDKQTSSLCRCYPAE